MQKIKDKLSKLGNKFIPQATFMLDSSQEVRDELSAATESDRTPTYHAECQNVFKSKI